MSSGSNIIGDSSHTHEVFFYNVSGGIQVVANDNGSISFEPLDEIKADDIAYFVVEKYEDTWRFRLGSKYYDGINMKDAPTNFRASYPSDLNAGNLLLLGTETHLTAVSSGVERPGNPLTVYIGATQLYTQVGGRCKAPYSSYEYLQSIERNPDQKFYTDIKLCGAGMDVVYCPRGVKCGAVIDGQVCVAPCPGQSLCTNEGSTLEGGIRIGCSTSMRDEVIQSTRNPWTWIVLLIVILLIIFIFTHLTVKTRRSASIRK